MRLKIAIFTETWLPKVDGVTSILQLMLRRLNEQGHKVLLFGPAGGPSEFAGAEIVGLTGPRFPLYPEIRINIPRRDAWERLKAFTPDLVHIVSPFFLGPTAFRLARRLNVPIMASYHTDVPRYVHHYYSGGIVEPLIWWYMRLLHNQAHVNLCPSSTMLRDLRAHGFKRVRWWHRGIDTQRFTPGLRDEAMRQRLTDGHPDDFLVINVGRHAPEKRLETIRPAFATGNGVRLAMVEGRGRGTYRPEQIGPLIDRLRSDPDLRQHIIQNGIEHARSRDWRTTMDQLIHYYYLTQRVFQRTRGK